MDDLERFLSLASEQLASQLMDVGERVVFAESCTAGLVAASLATIPGVSEVLCGSAVTYRCETKAAWIDVGRDELENPGPVSRIVAEQMAVGVLRKTSEASYSASVTGHLGPGAPPDLDGRVFIGVGVRQGNIRTTTHPHPTTRNDMIDGEDIACFVQPCQLTRENRHDRQIEAAARVLELTSRIVGYVQAWQSLGQAGCGGIAVGSQAEGPTAVLSGSFNPFHRGHAEIARLTEEITGQPVAFELSVSNVDKSDLAMSDAINRLLEMPSNRTIWLTTCSTFLEKSEIFPGATFAVGADTIARLGDLNYYGQNPGSRATAVQVFQARGCRFLVFGREINGQFVELQDVLIPDALRQLCQSVGKSDFAVQVSSTELRKPKS